MTTLLAFPHATGTVYVPDEELFQQGFQASRQSARLRIAFPVHRDLSDGVQRLLNFLQPDTYIPPHFHPSEGFSETIYVIQGAVLFLEFDQEGQVLKRVRLEAGTWVNFVDFVGPVIHTFACLDPDTVVLEIKKGPYSATNDKVFPAWAPLERDPVVPIYLKSLIQG